MQTELAKRHAVRGLVLRLSLMGVAMFGFGFLLVPMYDIFCDITGIRTEARQADQAALPLRVDESRWVTVEFVANRASGEPWEFQPAVAKMKVHPGKLYDTTFFARNLTDRALTGIATPDIKPIDAVRHFQKTECFCFTPQAFAPREGRDMAVRFIIDPALPDYVETVTLSYSFYAQERIAAGH